MKYNALLKVLAVVLALGMLVSYVPTFATAETGTAQQTVTVEDTVLNEMNANGVATYWVDFKNTADLSQSYSMDWSERGWFVYETLKAQADKTQAAAVAYLNTTGLTYQSYWIANRILVQESNNVVLASLQKLPNVVAISAQKEYTLYEPEKVVDPEESKGVEPNISHVLAPEAWALGFDGAGMVVANIDTGVRYTHEALVDSYRGNNGDGTFDHNYNWFNPYNSYDIVPRDGNGHGTHTMGTMVGDDGDANQIGIAPGAEWMACSGCPDGKCWDSALLGCGEFITAPTDLNGTNADPDMRPNVVNNSWGDCEQSYNSWYRSVIDAWQAAGIYPVFSTGNNANCNYSAPPGLNTVSNPARYGDVTGVGSSGRSNGQYASHSNWGPTDHMDNVNPVDGFEMMKPQVVAPGVSIRSSVPSSDTAYEGGWSGTSMSAPHVSGLVAIVMQAAPCLVGDYATVETIIESTATPITYDDGSPLTPTNYPNFAAGWGEINALAAVETASVFCGGSTLQGTVTSTNSDPVPGAKIVVTGGDDLFTRTTWTNAEGFWSVRVKADVYDINVSAFGFETNNELGVIVGEDDSVTKDIVLTPLPTATVSGVVTDGGILGKTKRHGFPLYALLTFTTGTVSHEVYTDPFTGEYTTTILQSMDYTVDVKNLVSEYLPYQDELNISSSTYTLDIELMVSPESCRTPGYYTNGFFEDFNSGVLPEGWTIVDYAGTGKIWIFDDPVEMGNGTGGDGAFANFDSTYWVWEENYGREHSGLRTPIIDLSDTDFVQLDLDTWYGWHRTWPNTGDIRYSTDGGESWTIKYSMPDKTEQSHLSIDLTEELAGESQVMIEFLWEAEWGNFWQIDNVVVGDPSCMMQPGGVVSGYVYDSNETGVKLLGATVATDHNSDITTSSTVEGANGLYWFFQPTSEIVDPGEPGISGVSEDFNSGVLPDGWTVIDYADTGKIWRFDDPVENGNGTGGDGAFANIDSTSYSWEYIDGLSETGLRTPLLDFSNTDTVPLDFDTWYAYSSSRPNTGSIRYSTDGGSSWTIKYSMPNSNQYEKHVSLDLTAELAGESQAMVEFYWVAGWMSEIWQIDNVSIGDSTKITYVEDVEFTVSKEKFETKTEFHSIEANIINRIDFTLDSGRLNPNPVEFEVTMQIGDDPLVNIFTIENDGTARLAFEIFEEKSGPKLTSISEESPQLFINTSVSDAIKPSVDINPSSLIASSGYVENSPTIEPSDSTINADVELILDDGSYDTSIGFTYGQEIIWFNRFTPNPESFPFFLNEIQVYFADDSFLRINDRFNLVIYENKSGNSDPTEGSTLLGLFPVTLQSVGAWNTFTLPESILLSGPGDVLIGLMAMERTLTPYFPAAIDASSSYQRSYFGTWNIGTTPSPDLPTDGMFDLIDNIGFPGNWMIRGMAADGEVLWLSENPTSGILEKGESIDIDLTIDPSSLSQPGDYLANLHIGHDTPYKYNEIPVILHLTIPPTYGTFNGTVNGLGKCDISPTPLEGATVNIIENGSIIGTVLTGKDGEYTWSLLAGTYDLEIVQNGYITFLYENVELPAEGTITNETDLRLDAPCLIVEPESLYEELNSGEVIETTVTFTNIGAKVTAIEIFESSGAGPVPYNLNQLAEIELILDDGTSELSIGLEGGMEFIWANRFTPSEEQLPFTLDLAQIAWSEFVDAADEVTIAVYFDADGDPSNGAEFLGKIDSTVGDNSGSFVDYVFDEPIEIVYPGDILIAAINRSGMQGYDDSPASIDQSSQSHKRSWLGWYAGGVPENPILPPDTAWRIVDEFGANFAGNWLIRGKGTAAGADDIVWLTVDPTADVVMPDGGTVEVTLTFDSHDLISADYFGLLHVKNSPDPRIYIPVQLRVLPHFWLYLPTVMNE